MDVNYNAACANFQAFLSNGTREQAVLLTVLKAIESAARAGEFYLRTAIEAERLTLIVAQLRQRGFAAMKVDDDLYVSWCT